MLQALSGQTHEVLTAVTIICVEQQWLVQFVERSQVTFNDLSDAVIDDYFTKVNPLDKAGAYGIQRIFRNDCRALRR